MRKKMVIKILILLASLSILAYIVFPETITQRFTEVSLFFQGQTMLLLLLFILGIVFTVIYIFFGDKIDWIRKRKALQSLTGKEKMYTILECEDAAKHYIATEFGIEDYSLAVGGGRLSVKSRFINSPSSDTPYAVFLLSLKKASLDKKDKVHELGKHMVHFVFVDRRTCEASYNPDIDDWEAAFVWLDKLRQQALPIELTKKPLEKAMEEEMKRRYVGRLGEELAGKKEENQKEVKGDGQD